MERPNAPPYGDRRAFAQARLPDGALILPAAPKRFSSGDSDYPYRPDSELLYLTGWEEPEAVAILRGFGDHRFILFVQPRDKTAEMWTGRRLGPEAAKDAYGADAAYPISELEARAPELLGGADRLYYRLGQNDRCDALVKTALGVGRGRRTRSGRGPFIVADPGAVLDPMRLKKDESEIHRMRRAADLTVASFSDAIGEVAPGVGEWAIEAALSAGFRSRGGTGEAFSTIVGAGSNGCTLHYVKNQSVIERDNLVLMDAGGSFEYYAADVTRTVPASGTFRPEQRRLYDVVLTAQRAALAACRPGASLDLIHEVAARTIVEGLIELGMLPDERPEDGEYPNPYFPHRTSHWLGLDTHDVGSYVGPDGPVVLEAGMVFTVEPGAYVPVGSCPLCPEYEGLGIRIEDDVLITEKGAEVLTSALPTDPDEIAELVAGRSAT